MGKKDSRQIDTSKLALIIYEIFELAKKEKNFLLLVAVLLFFCGILTPYPSIAMWFGFGLAGYSAIANDSIQTIGTFISSNQARKWWQLWLYIGSIFVVTVTYSWVVFNGDVSFQRLTSKGFSEAPTSFSFLQLLSPLVLIVLTRLRMPVSTTFLLLSAFSTTSGAIVSVLQKSLSGYFISFFVAIVVWTVITRFFDHYFNKKANIYWSIVQWISSGTLWSVWIMQDAANIAVFLPRQLSLGGFLGFTLFIFLGLGFLFYRKGDNIQKIVNEKSGITDVRAATIVDFVYALILIYFKQISTIPMSTTWVFIGLLGGREIAMAYNRKKKKDRSYFIRSGWRMIGKDVRNAAIGLIVSLILAIAVNDAMQEEFMSWIK